ncbi:MAG TPA: YcaO-like family protein [Candidatus Angelobacter sp.]
MSMHYLLQPIGGLMTRGSLFRAEGDEPKVVVQTVHFGNPGQLWPNLKNSSGESLTAAGSGLDHIEALLPALGEGVERYSASVHTSQQFITATAADLGKQALDLESVPRCSAAELSHPKCHFIAPDKHAAIRWVQGISLLDGRPVYLPLVMVYLYPGSLSRSEMFYYPISTGCAAHVSLERALLGAILEVVERDAISIIWLQKLALPRIEVDHLPSPLDKYWQLYQRSSSEVEIFFFDGTSDFGIPTVYGVQVSRSNPKLTTLVNCSTAFSPADAIAKVIRDMAACRVHFRHDQPVPESWDDFAGTSQGGAYMARREQAHAFDFLLQSPLARPLSRMRCLASHGEKQDLQMVLEIFRNRGLDVYAVELSTDEALRSGMRVVRVVIPGLQPVGFNYRARYLGHPRLYDAPAKMGHPVLPEAQLNHWPQPFA